MSDPNDIPGRKTPPRAEPVQPDKPGSGNRSESDSDGAAKDASARQEEKRADDALDNVREGYGGSPDSIGVDDPSMVPGRPASDAQ